MAALSDHAAQHSIKLLIMGDSGVGKTAALASLINSNRFRFLIHDFDNGLDVLRARVKPEAFSRVFYKTYTSKMILTGDQVYFPEGHPEAWAQFRNSLSAWGKEGDTEIGSIYELTPDDVIVIDSLSFLSRAAMQHVVGTNSKRNVLKLPKPADWGDCNRLIENILGALYSPRCRAHVIVNTHISRRNEPRKAGFQIEDKNAKQEPDLPEKWLPMAIGQAVEPLLPRYFNNFLLLEIDEAGRRQFHFSPRPEVSLNLKLAASGLESPIPAEGGLLEIFNALVPPIPT